MKFSNNEQIDVKLKRTGLILGILSACGLSIWGIAEAAIAYKLDQRYIQIERIETDLDPRYVTIAGYKSAKLEERKQWLQDEIFKLTFKINSGTATPLEKALLQKYQNELDTINSRG